MRVLCTISHRPLTLFLYSGVGECLPVAVLAVPVQAYELEQRDWSSKSLPLTRWPVGHPA